MHRSSSSYSTIVGEFSAGCQVRQYNVSHLKVWDLIQKALIHFPDSFSYTLFDEEDVFGVPQPILTRDGRSLAPQKWPEDYINVER
jgi:hypothetical protein